jgi:hypothetical protein
MCRCRKFCVYTIKRQPFLERVAAQGGSYEDVTEHKPWVSGEALFGEAVRDRQKSPIIFAVADEWSDLIYWAILTKSTAGPPHPVQLPWRDEMLTRRPDADRAAAPIP